ncbi:MAG: TetR/AcrR family transcriptional regulator [Dehalococcoidia bacterium]|nr:TetR/AcrR family transcriptional regulator [Dehalococcoidia bacterium]
MTQQSQSTPFGRLERRKARTRAAILEAATDLFFEQGYEETAIQQIAERADTGVGTLYGYFSSKEEILREVIRQTSQQSIERYLAAVGTTTHPIDRVCLALGTFAGFIRENRSVLVAAFQVAARHRRIDELPTEWLINNYQVMLQEGVDAHDFRRVPAATTARVLVGTYLQAMLGIGIWRGREDDPQTEQELEMIVRTLLTP